MRLVDDQHLVAGQHRRALDGVDGEERVVGDDDVGELGPLPGGLGEALRAVRALARAETLAGGDGDLGPGAVGHTRGQVVAVAGLGVRGPVAQPQQILAELAGRGGRLERVEEPLFLLLRHPLMEPVQAHVVRAALEHRELGAAAQQRVQRVHRAGQVPLHELPLEGERRGGDHHAFAVREGRHQIAEGLAGAGARLHQQVGVVVHGLGDGFGHGDLSGALRTAYGGDGGVQQIGEGGLRRHSPDTLRRGTDIAVHAALGPGPAITVRAGGSRRSRARPRAGVSGGRGIRRDAAGCG